MKKQTTILAVVFVAIGLVAMGAVSLALADTFTINATENNGLRGTDFVPTAFFGGQFAAGPDGTLFTGDDVFTKPCAARPGQETGDIYPGAPGGVDGDCTNWANAAISAWLSGGFYDPRRGTAFIPPSGDHHRAGYRLMMQPSFSAGAWLTGFAPLASEFPFFPQVGTPGAGEDSTLITLFLDAHGEPLTTGKFPRYWPHERQAWSDTLMVKYVASQDGGGGGFTQSLRSQVGQSRTNQTWDSMSNENADGCAGGWCHWSYTVGTDGIAGTTDDTLTRQEVVAEGPDGTLGTSDDNATVTTTVTSSRRIDSIFAQGAGAGRIFGPGPDGTLGNSDDGFMPMRGIEKTPTIVDDRLMQADNDLAGCSAAGSTFAALTTAPGGNPCAKFTGAPGPDGTVGTTDDTVHDRDQAGQALRYQFNVVSGPNFHSEEGADPYSWVICGTRGGAFGEESCNKVGVDGTLGTTDDVGGPINESAVHAFLKPAGSSLGALDIKERAGPDGIMFTSDDGAGPDGTKATSDDTVVLCTGTSGATTDTLGAVWGADCSSTPGYTSGAYGAGSDKIYYMEADENGLRGGIRHTVAHGFSFLNMDGNESPFSNTANTNSQTLRQLLTEDVEGFLVSCLNCGHPALVAPPTLEPYNWIFPTAPGTTPDDHPPGVSGSISLVNP